MKVRRFSPVQRAIAVLAVVAGLSSLVQLVFACELMDDRPSSVCCCGAAMTDGCAMGGGCGAAADVRAAADCCEMSVETLAQVTAGKAPSAAGLVALQNAPQPPAAPFPLYLNSHPEYGRFRSAFARETGPPFVRTGIYLVTNRLRI